MPRQASFDFPELAAEAAPDAGARPAPGQDAPLAYEMRVSKRAKRLTLRVVAGRGLIVTVPHRFPRRDVPAAVEAHRSWAIDALARADSEIPLHYREWPPRRLELAALGWRVMLGLASPPDTASGRRGARLTASGLPGERLLLLSADPSDRGAVAQQVADALKALARDTLPARLAELAARHRLRYARCSVRGQRSVWGSYSASGTLSLNYKLLFLPPALVDYVLLHELSHTRHLDHSADFWSLLERICAQARQHDEALRTAGRLVPPWLERAR